MRISKIGIKNVLGIEELEFKPGSFTKITGANGIGKTSVFTAMQSIFQGGHNAELIREGAEKAEVVFVVEDDSGNGPYTIKRTIRQKDSDLTVTSATLGPLRKPKTFVDNLIDALSANPVDFLNADPRDRLKWLLQAIPMTVLPAQLVEATGMPVDATEAEGHALEAISRVRDRLYGWRTQVNATAKTSAGQIARLAQGLPAQILEPSELRERQQSLRQERAALLEQKSKKEASVQLAIAQTKAKINQQLSEAIALIRSEADQKADEARMFAQSQFDALHSESGTAQREASEYGAARLDEISTELGRLDEQMEWSVRDANNRDLVESMTAEKAAAELKAQQLTDGIQGLEELKSNLLSALPIKGLSVDGGKISYQGIDFETLNHAERVKLAVKIAKLRAGRLGLICLDGCESLDDATFAALEKMAKSQKDIQFVCTRVTNEDSLQVETSA